MMARHAYRDRLAELRGEVGAMADVVLGRYDQAVGVLQSGDARAAERIIEGDAEINEWYLDAERDCIELIALQQPVASDLRFVASSFKIVTDVERIGDLAANLAAYGRDADGRLDEQLDVVPLATAAGEMVADAIDVYTKNDPEAARAVADRDEQFDDRCRQASESLVRGLVTGDPSEARDPDARIDDISRALLTIRDIERVGDHAVNICARTLYMIEHDDELIY